MVHHGTCRMVTGVVMAAQKISNDYRDGQIVMSGYTCMAGIGVGSGISGRR